MPVCLRCHHWIDQDAVCGRCGESAVEMTAVDARVAPLVGVEPLRPNRRPPVPLLVALDDDSDIEGEVCRLRDVETTIGRRGADWTFSCDSDMSATHAKVVRSVDREGRATWRLIDLNSSNGSFLKVSRFELSPADSVMFGAVLVHWEDEASTGPRLRVYDGADGGRVAVLRSRVAVTIGSDPAVARIHLQHRTVDPKHAVLRPCGNGWRLEDQSSRNGVWRRISDSVLINETRFMLGEQRFLFRIPQRTHTGRDK